MGLRHQPPSGTLWFPQYDQLIAAAIEGSGIAIGVLPHVAEHLRSGRLCAPFGVQLVAKRGAFFILIRRDVAGRPAVRAFVDWLRSEVERDSEPEPDRVRARARSSIR